MQIIEVVRVAACRSRRRIHAAIAIATSTRLLSSTPVSSAEKVGAEETDCRDVGVFWDFENCSVPSSFDPFLVRPNIERALRTSGFLGPISIFAFGDIHGCRTHTLEALSETGIDVRYVPNGGKNSSDRALMIDVLLWTMKHSPPAHVLLISGDSDFSILLHKLCLLNYNVLLAAPIKTGISSALIHAASRIWVWPDIAKGEGLMGQEHISGTPVPFQKDEVSRSTEASVTKPNTDLHQDIRHALDNVKDPREEVMNGFRKVSEAGWIPPLIVNRVISIVECCPGISLGEISKELRSMNINARAFGFGNTHQFLMSIPQLEIRFIDGLNMKNRTRYYLASTGTHSPGNALGHLVHQKSVPRDDGLCGIAESLDCIVGDKDLTKKGSLGQEKGPASSMPQSWVSRLFTLFKSN